MGVHDTLLPHRVDVEKRPDVPIQDASGGLVDVNWNVEISQLPCSVDSASPQQVYDFALAGVKVTHMVQCLQPVAAGRRLKLADGSYLRVQGYDRDVGQGNGAIPDWYQLACEEVRQS